jgi:hypothetical protein
MSFWPMSWARLGPGVGVGVGGGLAVGWTVAVGAGVVGSLIVEPGVAPAEVPGVEVGDGDEVHAASTTADRSASGRLNELA